MKLYRSYLISEDLIFNYAGTKAEAHSTAKDLTPRNEARVEEVEVATDKASLVALLNGDDVEAVQAWKLSPRGGLVDCPVGE